MSQAVAKDHHRDLWAEWMLHRRFGGETDGLQRAMEFLGPVRDKVLDHAAIAEGETVLDIGAGDGLIAFGALERVGESGCVIFSDISQDLLQVARAIAGESGVLDRCRFVRAAVYKRLQPVDTDPMLNFDERDLLRFAERARFGERHLEFRADVESCGPRSWDTFVTMAPNPRVPTLGEVMDDVLMPEERNVFEHHLRPLVEQGRGQRAFAVAFLWATTGALDEGHQGQVREP